MEKIALLPGGFKPPHAGHYNMAKWLVAITNADSVIIKIGSKERDGITRDISLKLWDLYRKADENSGKLVIVPSEQNSPVKDVYDFIEQDAPEGSTVYLGMGEKDIEDQRFKNIGKFAEPKNIKFKTVLVPPQAGGVSGTEMRGFIKDNDKENFQKYLPDHLSSEQKDEAWDIVSSLEEDFYDPRNKTVDFMRSSEYKAGMPDGHKDDIPRKGDQIHNRQTAPVSFQEQGADTSWTRDDETITLQDILELTKDIKAIDYPTKELAPKVLGWDDNPEEIERISQVEVSEQYPILIMIDEEGKIQWILDGNHRAQKALRSNSDTIPAKLIKPSDLNYKAKKILLGLDEQKGGKTLRVYDFDDTLAVTKGANIKIKHTDGSIDILDPAEFAVYDAQEGDKFDFTEFDKVIKDAEPIQNIVSMLEKDLQTTAKVTILTARLIAYPVRRYLKGLGLDVYVVAVGSSDPNDKAKWIENHIEKGYTDILFIDDSEKNRNAVLNLKDKYPDIKLDVQDPDSLNEMMYGMMTKAEKRKHKRKLRKIKKGLRK